MPKVNPEVLIWARETAGLSLEDAANKLGLSNPARLQIIESGEQEPSRRQLANMSERYRRPLLTFYMPNPPIVADKGQDFRTLPEGQAPGSEALLDALLRDVHTRQQLVRGALEEEEEDQELDFVGSAKIADGVDELVIRIEQRLDFNKGSFRAPSGPRNHSTVSEGFTALRAAVEKTGVFVILMGNLGTHHTDLDAKFFRGFALADKVAPFIIINEKDSKAAWSFTLLHELAHIWLGQSGVSGYESDVEIERFCDAVAAKFLLDPNELNEIAIGSPLDFDALKVEIGEFATARNLSRKMVAYNLLRFDHISAAAYRRLSEGFDDDRLALAQERRGGRGGPDYYVVKRQRVGPGLVRTVKRMVADGALTTVKAAKVLGVKPTAVNRLVDGARAA